MRSARILMLLIFFTLLMLGGCSQMNPNTNPVQGYPVYQEKQASYPGQGVLQTPDGSVRDSEPPTPQAGKASISGALVGYRFVINEKIVLNNAVVYLTPAKGANSSELPPILVGALTESGDILSKTDASGGISINNIPPGNYYLIYSIDLAPIITSKENLGPRLIQLSANQKGKLGELLVPIK